MNKDYYHLEVDRLSRVEINVSFDHAMGDIDALLKLNNQVVASATSMNNVETLIIEQAIAGTYELVIYGASDQVETQYQVNMLIDD